MIRRRWTWHSRIRQPFGSRRASACLPVSAQRTSPRSWGYRQQRSTGGRSRRLIDTGRKPGIKSYEPDELARARQRIKDLEAELELVKAASALFNGEEVVRPKGSARSFKDLTDLGYSERTACRVVGMSRSRNGR